LRESLICCSFIYFWPVSCIVSNESQQSWFIQVYSFKDSQFLYYCTYWYIYRMCLLYLVCTCVVFLIILKSNLSLSPLWLLESLFYECRSWKDNVKYTTFRIHW
jgi:hypothetical protein